MKTNTTQQNIPSGWKQVALGDLASVTTGKRDANHGSPDGQYPFFTCAQKVSKIDNFAFDTEAVLIAGNGDFNVKYYKGKFDAYQRTYVLSGFKDTTGAFVYQKAKQALNEIIKNNQGSSVKFIKMGDLTDYPLLLPPLKEQQKIAEILGTVDEDIVKTQEVIEATEKLKCGLMQELLRRSDRLKVTKFSKLVNLRIEKLKPNSGTDQKYIGLENIEQGAGKLLGFGDSSDTKSINSVFKKGDILFGKLRPYLRKYWKAEFDGVCTSEILVFKPYINTDIDFVFQLVQTDKFIQRSESKSFGTKMPRTDWKIISDFEIGLPSPERRKEIAEILSAVDEKILINKKLKEKLTLLKKGLMQDLLSGKVRINI